MVGRQTEQTQPLPEKKTRKDIAWAGLGQLLVLVVFFSSEIKPTTAA